MLNFEENLNRIKVIQYKVTDKKSSKPKPKIFFTIFWRFSRKNFKDVWNCTRFTRYAFN